MHIHSNYPKLAISLVAAIGSFQLGFALPAIAVPAVLQATEVGSKINIRSSPSTESSSPHYGLSGDKVEVQRQTKGKDGYTWYYVKFPRSGATGWVRSDLIRIASGRSKGKIANGNYAVGQTDLGLLVQGGRYRYYDEGGDGSWLPISKLQYIKEGVVFDGKDYWCLLTLLKSSSQGISVCSSNGWVQHK